MQGLLLAFILSFPWLGPGQPRTDPAAWQELVTLFQGRGVTVLNDHPRCSEPDLDGLYVRGQRAVVVCRRGDRASTLRHEGWHLVQSICLQGHPWLQPEAIDQALNRRDRRELQALVQPERWQREAEARAMANQPQKAYLQAFSEACRDRLPVLEPLPSAPDATPVPPGGDR
jgi:hypothetical protein